MANFGNALGGAAAGASAGSLFGPVGTGIGALLGGVGSLFGGKKKKKKAKQISTLDPQQQQLYSQYVASLRGEGPLANLNNFDAQGYNDVFDKTVAQPAYRGFQENIVPQITGQFRQGNIGNSSYAAEALSRAGRDVQESLDAHRAANIFQGQQQAQQNRQSGVRDVLGMQTFAMQRPNQGSPSTIDQILGSVAPQAGQWFADYLNKRGPSKPTMPAR